MALLLSSLPVTVLAQGGASCSTRGPRGSGFCSSDDGKNFEKPCKVNGNGCIFHFDKQDPLGEKSYSNCS
ncbi:hypothetical protein Slin15195_G082000 [Septoria linicola]|uniref:Uncharacterized protein n=1 Tax=Septoria linicola TaxID=215465 RepID=A0A9Q9B1Z1_9PEZI|nr:hypothetical protein Slin15195_G082000 [Septoria linicola]